MICKYFRERRQGSRCVFVGVPGIAVVHNHFSD